MLFASGPLRWRRHPAQAGDIWPATQPPPPGRAAVFIDKDSLLDGTPGSIDAQLLHLKPGVAEALVALDRRGFALSVVTNESGLARGCFTRAQFARLQAALEQALRAAAGVALLDFLVCPHAPGADGRPSCLCRMPAPGLLLRAARRHGIALERSWLVGGTLDHVEAGRRAGCRTLLLAGSRSAEAPRLLRQPDLECTGWADAACLLPLSGALSLPR
ncbi:histidinol-phosphate phosphatase family protein [Pelomonas aquatica]|uniref:D,D-heptose 1,7-bisphosphate phosphatase n=1 Tax=Pelomonas aquatica TaxID=431058 RepID=A0ABU1ZBJ2_9BURK|nr:HAD-IIIA family hydrolase [Pelomonas aquatica]MDR7297818.1 histidinol-phosphate phosphatase family protein [Pelomonas aquatica]